MSRPLLSIIIPTHNRSNLLHRAVGSNLVQTIDDLVVDDVSTVCLSIDDLITVLSVYAP